MLTNELSGYREYTQKVHHRLVPYVWCTTAEREYRPAGWPHLGLIGLAAFGVLLFVPAGTLDYWQAWVFLIVFAISTWIPALYLLRKNPAALERRMRAGPGAETRTVQKIVIAVAFASAAAMIVLSALDHRFGWSQVSPVRCPWLAMFWWRPDSVSRC